MGIVLMYDQLLHRMILGAMSGGNMDDIVNEFSYEFYRI